MNLKRCFNYGKMLWIKHVIPNLFRNLQSTAEKSHHSEFENFVLALFLNQNFLVIPNVFRNLRFSSKISFIRNLIKIAQIESEKSSKFFFSY